MRTSVTRHASLISVAALLVVGGLLLGLVACDGEDADEWIVFHANRVVTPVPQGGESEGVCSVPEGADLLAHLPDCVVIQTGQKIGFTNYYRDAGGGKSIHVKLVGGEYSPQEFDVEYAKSKIVKVIREPDQKTEVLVAIGTSSHGGPIILPKLP